MTNNIKIHSLWYFCITVRIIISFLPLIYNYFLKKNIHKNILKKISFFTNICIFLMGFGFLKASIFGSNNEVQINKVFWHNTIIIHACLFLLAGIYFNDYKLSSTLLFTDVIFSLIYRYNKGHFHN
jgi:hypothetical protein